MRARHAYNLQRCVLPVCETWNCLLVRFTFSDFFLFFFFLGSNMRARHASNLERCVLPVCEREQCFLLLRDLYLKRDFFFFGTATCMRDSRPILSDMSLPVCVTKICGSCEIYCLKRICSLLRNDMHASHACNQERCVLPTCVRESDAVFVIFFLLWGIFFLGGNMRASDLK